MSSQTGAESTPKDRANWRLGLIEPGAHLPADYWPSAPPGLARVEVELGSGDGGFLLGAAGESPDTWFVGIEMRWRNIRAIEAKTNLPVNIRVLRADARFVVREILATDSIDAFHLYFPDPWWKKRHAKRRLVTPEVADALRRTLRPGGRVFVLTDVAPRFQEIAAELERAGLCRESWERDPEAAGMSSYERKYRHQGRLLHQAAFLKSL